MKDVEALNKSPDLIIKDLVQHGKVSGHNALRTVCPRTVRHQNDTGCGYEA